MVATDADNQALMDLKMEEAFSGKTRIRTILVRRPFNAGRKEKLPLLASTAAGGSRP